MNILNLKSNDTYLNLATEEYLLKSRDEDFLILGINEKSVIIGKHQAAHRETNTRFITENNIPVIRRISGGGTVYHDRGNINFTFIKQSESGKQVDFRKYTAPVIDFLLSLGVNARFEGKNDLKINGLKISGNAEHVHRNRVLHHGTLLFDSSLDDLRSSLRENTSDYITRAVVSNPSSVTNLKENLKNVPDIFEFRVIMMNYFFATLPGAELFRLTPEESDGIKYLAETKYRTWEWNYAYGPDYHLTKRFELNNRPHACHLFVKDGIIQECEIEGSHKMIAVGKELVGCRHMVTDILKILNQRGILAQDEDVYNFF